ncbi:MAG: DUF4389 domain-containing protein [Acidiferrobacterales bacterium]|nr:DUF4389 domain-containing protein [Acidiferrobacterales bacterium]
MIDKRKSGSSQDHPTIWKRVLFMLLFVLVYSAAELVVFVVAVVQAGFVVLTGTPNRPLLEFGQSLAKFAYQILQFFLFETERMPFPFSDWPLDS